MVKEERKNKGKLLVNKGPNPTLPSQLIPNSTRLWSTSGFKDLFRAVLVTGEESMRIPQI